jgi:hypothetical protein
MLEASLQHQIIVQRTEIELTSFGKQRAAFPTTLQRQHVIKPSQMLVDLESRLHWWVKVSIRSCFIETAANEVDIGSFNQDRSEVERTRPSVRVIRGIAVRSIPREK